MRKEYDFSKGSKGKFYVAAEDIHLPVYLDRQNNEYFLKLAKGKRTRLSKLINDVLAKDRAIIDAVALQGE